MARRRLKPKGKKTYHHVVTRTAQQVYWLEDVEFKKEFVDLIDFFSRVYYIDVLGYVCMSNHIHLCLAVHRPDFDLDDLRRRHELAQTRLANPRDFREPMADHFYERYTDLSMFMWEINRRLALAYNKRKGTAGHLWGGRFKNIVVEDGQSLMNVLAYIELNPVRAGMVEDPSDFAYSSVGRIKTQLEQNKPAQPPAVAPLDRFPEEIRARTYLEWIRYVALSLRDPELKRRTLPLQFTAYGWEFDMIAVCEALETKAPGGWSSFIYGTQDFARRTLTEAGWLVPIKQQQEVAQSGPSNAAA